MSGLSALRGLKRSQEIEGLCDRHRFDRQDVPRVLYNALQFDSSRHAHGNVIFFIAGRRDRIDGGGMRQHFVFADQSRGGDLRHHETGVQSGARQRERAADPR